MKKAMTAIASILLSTMVYSGNATASEVIFDAARDCQARNTTTGIRYVPACDFQARQITPDVYNNIADVSLIGAPNFKTMLNYDFTCESLKPLSISMAMVGDGIEKLSTTLAGKASSSTDVASITHGFMQSQLNLNSLNGAIGFQAIKPGCQMTVEALVSYPEPDYLSAVSNGIKQMDGTLATILSFTTPTTEYINAIGYLQLGISLLVAQQQTFDLTDLGEALMYDLYQETIDNMETAMNSLTVNCQNSGSSYCTQALADTRNTLAQLISLNDQKLDQMKTFVGGQLSWLNGQSVDLRGDLSKLQNVYNAL
ncbi:hypothetical protein SG34_000160 [Thalassomonas viridans]|uniref:Conjugal transfer protein TraH n=1 Tax=Thalassomonas viridans TaxID=137584 RepID=A0AAF0C9F0_9GAMM|nr:hypothetical protein [Thalassomonas viridans]WDE05401.1 hypothetical protein SG34_000160 [Thalassomonas viridans]